MVHVPETELTNIVHRALARMGLSDAHVHAIAKVIVAGQRDARRGNADARGGVGEGIA